MKNESRLKLESGVIARALKDENFRQLLKDDPKNGIESELGIKLPESLKINIIEEKSDEIYLVLPAINRVGAEISDADLELVAGGWTGNTDCGTCAYC